MARTVCVDGVSRGSYGGRRRAYTRSLAGADVEAQSRDVARVTHEDSSSDLRLSSSRDRNRGARQTLVGITTTTVRVVHDLASLRVPDEDEEGIGALRVEGVDLARDRRDTLDDRVGVADAAAGGLPSACGVSDHFRGRAGEGAQDRVDDCSGSTVSGRSGGLARTEDVNLWAGCAAIEQASRGEGGAEKEERSCANGHVDAELRWLL